MITTKAADRRIGFYSLDRGLPFAAESIQKLAGNHHLWKGMPKSCKPMFLGVLRGELKEIVEGVDSPALLREVAHFIPPVPADHDD